MKCEWCGHEWEDSKDECDCLARIRCKDEGKAGHHQCGWCEKHDMPRFKCCCLYFLHGSSLVE